MRACVRACIASRMCLGCVADTDAPRDEGSQRALRTRLSFGKETTRATRRLGRLKDLWFLRPLRKLRGSLLSGLFGVPFVSVTSEDGKMDTRERADCKDSSGGGGRN